MQNLIYLILVTKTLKFYIVKVIQLFQGQIRTAESWAKELTLVSLDYENCSKSYLLVELSPVSRVSVGQYTLHKVF